jgi:hypothetical protein
MGTIDIFNLFEEFIKARDYGALTEERKKFIHYTVLEKTGDSVILELHALTKSMSLDDELISINMFILDDTIILNKELVEKIPDSIHSQVVDFINGLNIDNPSKYTLEKDGDGLEKIVMTSEVSTQIESDWRHSFWEYEILSFAEEINVVEKENANMLGVFCDIAKKH